MLFEENGVIQQLSVTDQFIMGQKRREKVT